MPNPQPAKPDEVVRILERLGFRRVRQSGSHGVYRHPDGRWTTVSIHKGKDIGRGLLGKIMKDIGLSAEEFGRLR